MKLVEKKYNKIFKDLSQQEKAIEDKINKAENNILVAEYIRQLTALGELRIQYETAKLQALKGCGEE